MSVKHNMPALHSALREYQSLTGKRMGDILANEAKWFSIGIYQEFKDRRPAPSRVMDQAVSRGFTMGRKANSITMASEGISRAAWRRADSLLEGSKSDTFKLSISDGVLAVRRARFSARRGNRLLRGGRYGNRFGRSVLRASEIERQTLDRQKSKNPGLKQLNRRALATAVEISLRQRAAKGGLMAVQWLPKVWKRRSSSVVKRGPLVTRSTQNLPLGQVDFVPGSNGEPKAVVLSAFVPGTARQIERHGILERVEAARVKDRYVYIDRKMKEAAAQAFRR